MTYYTEFPNKKYKTIIIDPPWPVEPMILEKYQLSVPYKTMSLEEIKQLPINNLGADDSILFLWTTHTFLPDAFDVLKAWGFKYYVLITWDKVSGLTHQGIFRKTEFVLLGYKGKLTKALEQKGKAIPTLFREAKGRHSEKPQMFDNIILKTTEEPRIDIFARIRKHGFDSYGNEPPKDQQLENFVL